MDTRSITVEAAKDIAFVKEKLQESMEDEATLTIRRWLYPDSKFINHSQRELFYPPGCRLFIFIILW